MTLMYQPQISRTTTEIREKYFSLYCVILGIGVLIIDFNFVCIAYIDFVIVYILLPVICLLSIT